MTLSAIAALADKLSRWLSLLMTGLAALAIGAIVLVLVFSSLQRYLLARPIPATEEIAAYLFVFTAFASMVGGLVEGRHIRVLPLWRKLPEQGQNWAMLAGHIFSIAVLIVLIRETYRFAKSSLDFGARSYVSNLLEWPWMMIIPGALGLLALAVAFRCLADLDRVLNGGRAPEMRHDDAEEAV